jgi:hypothetical protein
MPNQPQSPHAVVQLEHARKRLAFSRLHRRHVDASMSFRDVLGALVLLTPTRLTETPWRVTCFTGDGEPAGHSLARTHREALEAAEAYGALPDSALAVPRRGGVR